MLSYVTFGIISGERRSVMLSLLRQLSRTFLLHTVLTFKKVKCWNIWGFFYVYKKKPHNKNAVAITTSPSFSHEYYHRKQTSAIPL